MEIYLHRIALAFANSLNIVASAHAEGIVKYVGEFEGEISGVIRAQTTAGQSNFDIGSLAIEANGRHFSAIEQLVSLSGSSFSP